MPKTLWTASGSKERNLQISGNIEVYLNKDFVHIVVCALVLLKKEYFAMRGRTYSAAPLSPPFVRLHLLRDAHYVNSVGFSHLPTRKQ